MLQKFIFDESSESRVSGGIHYRSTLSQIKRMDGAIGFKKMLCARGAAEISRWSKPPVYQAATDARPDGARENATVAVRRPFRTPHFRTCFRWFHHRLISIVPSGHIGGTLS